MTRVIRLCCFFVIAIITVIKGLENQGLASETLTSPLHTSFAAKLNDYSIDGLETSNTIDSIATEKRDVLGKEAAEMNGELYSAAPKYNDTTVGTSLAAAVPAATDDDANKLDQFDHSSKCGFNFFSAQTPCECYRFCSPPPEDDRQKVCGKSNTTYDSDCILYHTKCQCKENISSCKDLALTNESLDYYGRCTELEQCYDISYEQFFERVSRWITTSVSKWVASWLKGKNVSDIANENTTSSIAAAFLFCMLDLNGNRIWEADEMAYMLATFKLIEPCFQRFLADCDVDSDGTVTITEWAKCLKLDGIQSLKIDCKL